MIPSHVGALVALALVVGASSISAEETIQAEARRLLLEAVTVEVARLEPERALEMYGEVIRAVPVDDPVGVRAGMRAAHCERKLGRLQDARLRLERLLEHESLDGGLRRRIQTDVSRIRRLQSGEEPGEPVRSRRTRPRLTPARDPGKAPALLFRLQALFRQRLFQEHRLQTALQKRQNQLASRGHSARSLRDEMSVEQATRTRTIEEQFEETIQAGAEALVAEGHDPVTVDRTIQRLREEINHILDPDFPFQGLFLSRISDERRFRERVRQNVESWENQGYTLADIAGRMAPILARFQRSQATERRRKLSARVQELKSRGVAPQRIRLQATRLTRAHQYLGLEKTDPVTLLRSLYPDRDLGSIEIGRQRAQARRERPRDRSRREQQDLRNRLAKKERRIRELEAELERRKESP